MKNISLRIEDIPRITIPIGFEGEQNHTCVMFNCKSVFSDYPNAVPVLVIKPETGEMYSHPVTKDGNQLIWNVTADNVSGAGTGKFQFTFTDGEEVFKSGIGLFEVTSALDKNGDIPSLMELVHATATFPTGAASTYTAGQLKKTAFRPSGMINKPIKAIKSVAVTGFPTGIEWSYKIGYDNGGILDLWSRNKTNDSISVPAGSVTVEYDFYK